MKKFIIYSELSSMKFVTHIQVIWLILQLCLWISCVTQKITVDVCFSGLLIYEVGAIVTPFPFLPSLSFDEKIIRKIEKSTI